MQRSSRSRKTLAVGLVFGVPAICAAVALAATARITAVAGSGSNAFGGSPARFASLNTPNDAAAQGG